MDKKGLYILAGVGTVAAVSAAGYYFWRRYKKRKLEEAWDEVEESIINTPIEEDNEPDLTPEEIDILESAETFDDLKGYLADREEEIDNPEPEVVNIFDEFPGDIIDDNTGKYKVINEYSNWDPVTNKLVKGSDDLVNQLYDVQNKLNEREEEENMKYDADSLEARGVYYDYLIQELKYEDRELSDICAKRYGLSPLTDDQRRITIALFERLFDIDARGVVEATNEYDQNIFEEIKQWRADYFGDDSVWVEEANVTFSEILLYFARRFEDDCIDASLVTFIHNCFLSMNMYMYDEDVQFAAVIQDVMHHNYFDRNKRGTFNFSIFGEELITPEDVESGDSARFLDGYNRFLERVLDYEAEYDDEE